MADWVVEYTGTITKAGSESGLPNTITAYAFVRVRSREDLSSAVDNEMKRFIVMGGMAVSIDPAQIVDSQEIDLDNRMFVPMAQIIHIRARIKAVTGLLTTDENETKGWVN
jgi:hypothetical protein